MVLVSRSSRSPRLVGHPGREPGGALPQDLDPPELEKHLELMTDFLCRTPRSSGSLGLHDIWVARVSGAWHLDVGGPWGSGDLCGRDQLDLWNLSAPSRLISYVDLGGRASGALDLDISSP